MEVLRPEVEGVKYLLFDVESLHFSDRTSVCRQLGHLGLKFHPEVRKSPE